MDDRNRGRAVGGGPALARLLHHPAVAGRQRFDRILGRAAGGQCDRGAEGQARDQGAGETRWQMDHAAGAGAGAGRRHPPAPGRHRAGGCASARRRRGLRGSVRADGRVVAGHEKARRGGVFRLDHPARGNRRAGLCHGRQDVLRQDRRARADRAHHEPFPESRAEDRQLPDHAGGRPGHGHHRRWDLPRRPDPDHAAVRSGADRRGDSGGDAHGPLGDHGGRRAPARQEAGDRQQAGRDRGAGGRGRPVRRQDRDPDPEQADAGRSVQRRRRAGRRGDPQCGAGLESGQRRHHRPRRAGWPEGRQGAPGLRRAALPAVRSGAQADRGDRQGRRWQHLQGHQGRAPGHPRAGRQCRGGEGRRREGRQRLRRARLPGAGRGPGGWRRRLAAARRAAAVRSAARRCQVDHRDRAPDGRADQDGDRRRLGDRPRDRPGVGYGRRHPRWRQPRRCQA